MIRFEKSQNKYVLSFVRIFEEFLNKEFARFSEILNVLSNFQNFRIL